MKTSQFVLLLVLVLGGQIIGFGLVLSRLQSPTSPSPSELQQVQHETHAHSVESAVELAQVTSTSAPNARNDVRQPNFSAPRRELQNVALDASKPAAAESAHDDQLVAISTTPTIDLGLVATALQESNAIVHRALSTGQWTAADNAAMRRHLLLLSPQDRLQVVLKVHRALERRELTLDRGAVPPS